MSRRSGPRFAVLSAVLTLVIGGVGLIAMLILNAFVLDKYDAYGEVSIPGSTSLHLPAGEATVNFHTMVTGSPSSGFPIPDLKFTITPPEGVAKPQVTESIGGTTTVNSDTHVQVWVVQIAQEGTYGIETDGNVNGYINPRLAFGHGSSYGWLTWVFGGLL
ncbi:MAG TPA: SHOCT domain-containing protein, partial [Mycobacterium sp.]|nr:SHOCT domain-containing protein [Mycobacterium sp.]